MSVEQTLAQRGERYGDFSDHAAICQDLMRVMQRAKNHNSWPDLTDVQRQALTVIADKIARILSGDPNYADNWHDIQGYAKLVEDRLPTEPNRCPHCAAAEDSFHHPDCHSMRRGKSALGQAVAAAQAEVIRRSLEADMLTATGAPCPECGWPEDGSGTHYATCSRLTAPKEFVEQVEQMFDELEMHEPAVEMTEADAAQQAFDTGDTDDPFANAPEWAKFKAQDGDGEWRWYASRPTEGGIRWHDYGDGHVAARAEYGAPNPNWRDTLIERTSG